MSRLRSAWTRPCRARAVGARAVGVRARWVAAVLALVGWFSGASAVSVESAARPAEPVAWAALDGAVEAARAADRVAGLAPSACLRQAAREHAQAMAGTHTARHQDLGRVLARCRLTEVGENVAAGYPDAAAATAAWLASPRHRANLLDPVHRVTGAGAAVDDRGVTYVSQLFGA